MGIFMRYTGNTPLRRLPAHSEIPPLPVIAT